MDEADLRQVIVEPADRVGLTVEPSLVEMILTEADRQPGVLPLVSHALLETWKRREGGTLTLAGYREAGGLREAVARTAEQIHERLDEPRRRLLREIFLRLTTLGEGTEDTRRRVRRAELGSVGGADAQSVDRLLADLTAARLVTMDEDGVTVTHEALIRSCAPTVGSPRRPTNGTITAAATASSTRARAWTPGTTGCWITSTRRNMPSSSPPAVGGMGNGPSADAGGLQSLPDWWRWRPPWRS
jgi:hypothetical protein